MRRKPSTTRGGDPSANLYQPCVIWFTGLSGAGKSTLAQHLDARLSAMGVHTYVLDGDNLRRGLNADLGYTASDRVENVRRVGEVAKLMVDAGLVVIVALISPFRDQRDAARSLLDPGKFCEVFVDTPLAVAVERDPKGLYRKAKEGLLPNFTGIDSPYEAPLHPDLTVQTVQCSPEEAVDRLVELLRHRAVISKG